MRCSSTADLGLRETSIQYVHALTSCKVCKSTALTAPQYQLALHQIDSMRRDGKFVGVDGTVPEGQGIVMAHLNECHELLEMVRVPPPRGRRCAW